MQVWGCSRARDILGSLRPRPEKTTCSFPCRFSGKSRNSGLVPGNRDPNLRGGNPDFSGSGKNHRCNRRDSRDSLVHSDDVSVALLGSRGKCAPRVLSEIGVLLQILSSVLPRELEKYWFLVSQKNRQKIAE